MASPPATPIPWIANSSWMAATSSSASLIPASSNFKAALDATSVTEASYVGAEYLRERLEQEDEHSLYDVSTADVSRIIQKLGIR